MKVSAAVIVPVRGGNARNLQNLKLIIDAADAYGALPIIVDNGISPFIKQQLLLDGRAMIPFVEKVGSYAARNVGVQVAREAGAEVLLFTDSDCVPVTDWPSHIIRHCKDAEAVVSVCAPVPVGKLGSGAHEDYVTRLTAWAGGPVRCGASINTVDTRAAAIRAEVFETVKFDERLRIAGDALFGRKLSSLGGKIVGCHFPCLKHDPPASWGREFLKYARIAAMLQSDLRGYPRNEVYRFLPEHAPMRFPPQSKDVVKALTQLPKQLLIEGDEGRYRAWREIAWKLGRQANWSRLQKRGA